MTRAVVCLLLGAAVSAAAEPRLRLPEGDNPPEVLAVAFSPDGKSLASAGHRHVAMFDSATGKPIWRAELEFGVRAVAFSPDGSILAAGGSDPIVRLYRATDGTELRRMKGHAEPVRALAFLPDGKRIITADDKALRTWDATAEKTEPEETTLTSAYVDQLFVTTAGEVVRGGRYQTWLCAANQLDTPKHRLSGRRVAGAAGLIVLAVGPKLCICDPSAPVRSALVFPAHRAAVTALSCSPDARLAASTGSDGRVAAWDPLTGERLFEADCPGETPAVAVSPDGRSVAAGGAGVLIWDVPPTNGGAAANEKGLTEAWDALVSEGVAESSAAMRTFRTTPASVAFLRDHLRPDEDEMNRVTGWLKQLEAERFAAREAATRSLRGTGSKYLAVLRHALETTESREAQRRLTEILTVLENPEEMYRQRLRMARGVRLLMRADTADARQALKELAAGDPAWPASAEAKAMIARQSK